MYVLVRNDLGKSYKFVQGFHALAQWMIDFPGTWKNSTIVILNVRDENELFFIGEKLKMLGINYSTFNEPDIGNELTSIASYCDNKVFSKMNLA